MSYLPRKIDGTPLTADEILKMDVKNILKKMTAGKPLSASEREVIRAAGYNNDSGAANDTEAKPDRKLPKHANDKNMRGIIERECNCSERKAYSWLTKLREKYWSKSLGWRVEDVVNEIETRQRKAVSGPDQDLKREKLKLECDILRDRRDRERGELMARREVEDAFTELMEGVRGGLENWVQQIAAEKRDADLLAWAELQRDKAIAMIRERTVSVERRQA
jgi:hypothetical protein